MIITQARRGSYSIDIYGIPTYTWTTSDAYGSVYRTTTTGLPLPYYDEVLRGGQRIERCYVDPISPVLDCVTWTIKSTRTPSSYTGARTLAAYSASVTDDKTLSEAPRVTSIQVLAVQTPVDVSFTQLASASTTSKSEGYRLICRGASPFMIALATVMVLCVGYV